MLPALSVDGDEEAWFPARAMSRDGVYLAQRCSMKSPLVMVIDCGSTKIAVTAVDDRGHLIYSLSLPNSSHPQPGAPPGWSIWDWEEIWDKVASLSRQVCAAVATGSIVAVTATTFGADGAPVRPDGQLAYPPISWRCSRTQELAVRLADKVSPWEVYQQTGYQIIPFNTLLRLLWLRENAPETLEPPNCWLMMPGLLSLKLSGERSIDSTSATTTMAIDLSRRTWSARLLDLVGIDRSLFPRWVEPGDVIGYVTSAASAETGFPAGIPVVATGHDTQFAPVGSGARQDEAVLSSGTWEILMARLDRCVPNRVGFEEGLLIELDAQPGLLDPQILMIGSAVLEWVRRHFFAQFEDRAAAYSAMICAARESGFGARGLLMLPSFVHSSGPARKHGSLGALLGLTLESEPGDICRAALEGLSFQMCEALRILQNATGFVASGLRVVGGGSRNDLWNQIRADVSGLPVTTIEQREATTLGAAMFAFVGAGVFDSIAEAQAAFDSGEVRYEPGPDRSRYEDLFRLYSDLPPRLQPTYRRLLEIRTEQR